MTLPVGTLVQTPLGKAVVRQVRNGGQVLVEVHGRAVVMMASSVTVIAAASRPRAHEKGTAARTHTDGTATPVPPVRAEIDLHGLRVEEALAQVERALSDAMLADVAEMRIVHGRGTGRIRAALHRRLEAIPSVRAFRLDPRNPGVTIVSF